MIRLVFFIFLYINSESLPALDRQDIDIKNYLAKRQWTLFETKDIPKSPLEYVVPILIFKNGSNVPSCGIIFGSEPDFEYKDIFGPEDLEMFPHCISIDGMKVFMMLGEQYLVLTYSVQDTRTEKYENSIFFRIKDQHIFPDKKLNNMLKSIDQVEKQINIENQIAVAKSELIKSEYKNLKFLERDFISNDHSSFSVFKEEKTNRCVFVTESNGELKRYSSQDFVNQGLCIEFLATGKASFGDKALYLAIFIDEKKEKKVAVISINNSGAVSAEVSLSERISQSGKVNDIKSIKKYIAKITQ